MEALAVMGMFIVRIGVPLAITVAVGMWLRRLDQKWEAEAQAQMASERAVEHDVKIVTVVEEPCWKVNNCSESKRSACPASQFPSLPCWMARLREEGHLPGECSHCKMFAPKQVVQTNGHSVKQNV